MGTNATLVWCLLQPPLVHILRSRHKDAHVFSHLVLHKKGYGAHNEASLTNNRYLADARSPRHAVLLKSAWPQVQMSTQLRHRQRADPT